MITRANGTIMTRRMKPFADSFPCPLVCETARSLLRITPQNYKYITWRSYSVLQTCTVTTKYVNEFIMSRTIQFTSILRRSVACCLRFKKSTMHFEWLSTNVFDVVHHALVWMQDRPVYF